MAGIVVATVGAALAAPPRSFRPPAAQVDVSALSGQALRSYVEGLLTGYEPADPAGPLGRIGQAAADVLLAIAADPATPPLRRLRAIEALGHMPTAAGLGYLRQVVAQHRGATDAMGTYELAAAARALGGYGPAGVRDLLALAGHPSADVREGAAVSLGRVRTPEAVGVLQRRLSVERDADVRRVIAGALAPAR